MDIIMLSSIILLNKQGRKGNIVIPETSKGGLKMGWAKKRDVERRIKGAVTAKTSGEQFHHASKVNAVKLANLIT